MTLLFYQVFSLEDVSRSEMNSMLESYWYHSLCAKTQTQEILAFDSRHLIGHIAILIRRKVGYYHMRTPGPTRDHRSNAVVSQAMELLSMRSTLVIPPLLVIVINKMLECLKVVVPMAMMLSGCHRAADTPIKSMVNS